MNNNQRIFGNVLFSDEEQQRIQVELQKPLEADEIAVRAGNAGDEYAYIEGWRAVEKANLIFGFDGWSDSIVALEPDYVSFHKPK